MKILVTGSAGQLGTCLVESFRDGNDVIGIDIQESVYSDVQEVTVKGDVRDYALVKKLVKDVDVILHTAAQVSVEKSIDNPIEDADINILGTLNLLKASSEFDLKRFVYFSSAAVYGNPKKLPVSEAHAINPLSPYGVSKYAGEKYCFAFSRTFQIPVTCIRPFNFYGKSTNDLRSSVISSFVNRVRNNLSPIIYGDGEQTRDFVSVEDVAALTELVLRSEKAEGEVFNCGTGVPTTINRLAQMIIELFGKDLSPEYRGARDGDIRESYADISKAITILGFKPKISLIDGLKEIVDGYAQK